MEDISISQVISHLWGKRKSLLKTAMIVAFVSLILVLMMPDEYLSKVVIIPEESSSQEFGGTLGSLADIAGVNLGAISGSETLSPALYPKIISSTPFVSLSLDLGVSYKGEETTLRDYLDKEIQRTPFGYVWNLVYLPAKIKRSLTRSEESISSSKDSSLLKISYEELQIMENFRERVWIESDDESGSIGVFVKMQDPKIAARVAHMSYEYLTTYLEEHITAKEKKKLSFVTKQYNQAKEEYYSDQKELANFIYENRNVQDPRYNIRQEELESKVNLSGDIFFQFAKELETSRIQLENQTPVFTVLEPAVIPVEKAYPNRTLIMFLSVFAALMIHSGILVLKLLNKEL